MMSGNNRVKQKVTPTCRYGHGELKIVNWKGDKITFCAPAIDGDSAVVLTKSFSFSIYECPICTYIEHHDDDDKEDVEQNEPS